MGFRNPFRIHIDQKTGWILMGDYGPDAGSTDPNRGPQGSVSERGQAAGQLRLAVLHPRERPVPQHHLHGDAGAGTNNGPYNCTAPVNNSPNNTGLTNLPPARRPRCGWATRETDTRFPDLGGGGAPTGGTRYYFDEDSESDTKFPKFYDGQWFIGEWNNDWIKTATLEQRGARDRRRLLGAICTGYISPMDMEFGPDGSLYVVEWGQGFNENNPDSGVYRVDYIQGARSPIANATVNNDAVPVGTTVNFSSAGSDDRRHQPHLPVGLRATARRRRRRRTRRTPSRRPAPMT